MGKNLRWFLRLLSASSILLGISQYDRVIVLRLQLQVLSLLHFILVHGLEVADEVAYIAELCGIMLFSFSPLTFLCLPLLFVFLHKLLHFKVLAFLLFFLSIFLFLLLLSRLLFLASFLLGLSLQLLFMLKLLFFLYSLPLLLSLSSLKFLILLIQKHLSQSLSLLLGNLLCLLLRQLLGLNLRLLSY